MKKFLLLASVFLLLSLVIPVSATTADNPLVVDLIAGQNQDAGDVKVWDDGTSLYVQYETTNPWCLTETHLAVASSLQGIPQKNGNPIPGQFPYKNDHRCTTSFLYTIPLDSGACELYIAAHAVVKAPGSTETAWGSGIGFPGKNWGTYFIYKTNACSYTPTPSQTNTATSTPTNTPTATPTNTPTSTPTNTPTNTATFTPTNTPTDTPTNTPTNTPTTCQPTVVTADFSQVALGQSVEGLGAVAPGLNIDAKGTAVKLLPNVEPTAYFSNTNGVATINGYMAPSGGFTDLATRNAGQPHLYTFTFAPGLSVSNFSLHMLDFGDWNPTNSTNHYVSLTAYDGLGNIIAKQELSYTTPPDTFPQSSDLFGNLSLTGDASAAPGQPGNWTWNVSGNGIVKVVLEFGAGYDPNFALDSLSFATQCPQARQPKVVTTSSSNLALGQSVEGLGVVAPGLNIDAKGTAIKLLPDLAPIAYYSNTNGVSTINGYMTSNAGFAEPSVDPSQPHSEGPYTFTFAPGLSVSNFSLHMLDFGDWNPTNSTNHYVSMTAYNSLGSVVAKQELSYITPPDTYPQDSDLYGNLSLTGDASAAPGQPGNWTWNVSGNGIVKIVLEFGVGVDPNVAFDLLFFTTECP